MCHSTKNMGCNKPQTFEIGNGLFQTSEYVKSLANELSPGLWSETTTHAGSKKVPKSKARNCEIS